MVAIVRRKITKKPQLVAGQELLGLVYRLKDMGRDDFIREFNEWKSQWKDFLAEKTINPLTGSSSYTHRRLHSAMCSVSFYLSWLFTFDSIKGMPRTNNAIEGTFTNLKNHLRNHQGKPMKDRQKLIDGFFLGICRIA